MKSFNKLITKIGVDKLLHFSVGGFIVALYTIVTALQESVITSSILLNPFAGLVLVALLSTYKELVLDETPDWKDIVASVLGAVPVFIAVALGLLFK